MTTYHRLLLILEEGVPSDAQHRFAHLVAVNFSPAEEYPRLDVFRQTLNDIRIEIGCAETDRFS